ncbi:MAG: hypothetical protein GF329_18460, partial [Candidatus Lokiarchaeota archaeon]|nr:hypothetical protein [Candidatus Lokiarchaeota archaeon]
MAEILVHIEPQENLGNKIVLNQENANKLNAKTGNTIFYSDKTSGISGEAILQIGDCNEYIALMDSNIHNQFENNMKWMGSFTLKVRQSTPPPSSTINPTKPTPTTPTPPKPSYTSVQPSQPQ